MLHELVRLQSAKLCHVNALRRADARQIVTQQIDDHHILRPVFFTVLQFITREEIRFWPARPLPGALDWSRLHFPLDNLQEPLGRRATNLESAKIEVPSKRGRISAAKTQIERDGLVVSRIKQTLREIHLKDVTGANV